MNINGKHYRTIWLNKDNTVSIINQELLPFEFRIDVLKSCDDFCSAISSMKVRGAGLIGAAAAYGVFAAACEAPENNPHEYIRQCTEKLIATRPTAANLAWAVRKVLQDIALPKSKKEIIEAARAGAEAVADSDAESCRLIGEHGVEIIRSIYEKTGRTVNILTHCNAGWLAFVDYGSACAPVYAAYEEGIPVHVWVDETRPRNQGASLTAWELGNHGVPHTLLCDNTGGHLMQHGMVDMVITGADRVTRTGDAANKIGTYLKALAAKDNDIPFYVAFPSSTFDWTIADGVKEIPIEQRDMDEVRYIHGDYQGNRIRIRICPENTPAANYGFDVTPSRLITALITERGVCGASGPAIAGIYGDHAAAQNE